MDNNVIEFLDYFKVEFPGMEWKTDKGSYEYARGSCGERLDLTIRCNQFGWVGRIDLWYMGTLWVSEETDAKTAQQLVNKLKLSIQLLIARFATHITDMRNACDLMKGGN